MDWLCVHRNHTQNNTNIDTNVTHSNCLKQFVQCNDNEGRWWDNVNTPF